MVSILLEIENRIAQTFGYVWAIRFEDILKVIAGFILGGFYVIYRLARIFLHLKRKENLKDGEVLFLKAKRYVEIWANSQTITGSFYAIFNMVAFPLIRRQHSLQSKRAMHLFSIIALVFCVIILYVTVIYTITVFAADPSACKK